MYELEVRQHVDRIFKKLSKRDRKQMEATGRKIGEILREPHAFKAMRFPLVGMRRAHFGKSRPAVLD
ncbi:MAG: hypothetical protein JRN56_03920 [Nitrososphaerota archaeon]|jgi:mRNA-degrading endonuclease RelE of RelBE toxin-antitoxin system|nr:hypothetical protein [Nitrososphaerota archaeon]MDG6912870.1 hypothetical protein [Nitrososphaerota archaeon]MDG6937160.1 hypothetical protein [Nitrososphaerota archaeon]MDG6961826.1 hypothetical protein [Nitrososphaerota archaeon]MDG6962483.1 hypothetical protein [Nitrososphaerota archaeon]